ncbi:hypothetical protein SAMN05519103_00711 [Rhizobiales bacterium GAS113]|nr:hypothetical protein SAMN05519103_00711 [Rhizobiales bacterium GAS113]
MKFAALTAIAAIALTTQSSMATPTGVMQCKTSWASYQHDGKNEDIPAAKGTVSEYTLGKDFVVARQLIPLDVPMMAPCEKTLMKNWSDLMCQVTLSKPEVAYSDYKREDFEVFANHNPPVVMRWSIHGPNVVMSHAQCTWTSGGQ